VHIRSSVRLGRSICRRVGRSGETREASRTKGSKRENMISIHAQELLSNGDEFEGLEVKNL
jgi:hypothetical protein